MRLPRPRPRSATATGSTVLKLLAGVAGLGAIGVVWLLYGGSGATDAAVDPDRLTADEPLSDALRGELEERGETAAELGARLFEAEQFDEARRVLLVAREESPDDPEVLYHLGRVLGEQLLESEQAVGCLERAVELAPDVGRYREALAMAYGIQLMQAGSMLAVFRQRDKLERIETLFLEALELDPSLVEARQGLLMSSLMTPRLLGGDPDRARELADELLDVDPVAGHLAWSTIHRQTDELDAAEASLLRAVELDPADTEARNLLGYFYSEQERYADAERVLTENVELAPAEPNGYDSLGDLYRAQELHERAEEAYRRALEVDPDFPSSIYRLAQCRAELGDPGEAEALFRRFLELRPRGPRADHARDWLEREAPE